MHIHFESGNIPFLKMSFILKSLGVDNNAFFLALYDEDLKHVDPHDPTLTTEQKHKVLLECARNPWYFLREVARVREMGDLENTYNFPLNKGTLAILYTTLNGFNHVSRLPRQHHRELTYKYLFIYQFLFGSHQNKIELFNIYGDENHAMIDFIRNVISELPEYFHTPTKFVDNLKEFKNNRIHSSISKVKIPKSIREADIISRGLTGNIHYYHLSDHNKYIETLFNGSIPNFSRSGQNDYIKGLDKIYSIMISSFINDDENSSSSRFVESLIDKSLPWEDAFFDMEPQVLHELMYKDSPSNFMYIEYDFLQLGKSQEWFERQCKLLNNDQDKIDRELLLKR